MQYSKELRKMCNDVFGGYIPVMAALDEGSMMLGEMIARTVKIIKPIETDTEDELDKYIIAETKRNWKKQACYDLWVKEYNKYEQDKRSFCNYGMQKGD